MNPVTQLCRLLRNNQTLSEKLLWYELRRRNINNQKFLRQYPIFVVNGFGRRSFYIADFYCDVLKLVIEVDGPIHLQKKDYDANRDLVMQGLGLTILRFTDDEVKKDLGSVVNKIANHL
ncbi:very-short-patch-repair endonuclease [Mucilaginibacter sp. UYP25]|uniref:endonuclease domain-containing protein n=1 Tax=unclassified Mucilaginibacter TaxID=2617802 RepID=UPI00339498B0